MINENETQYVSEKKEEVMTAETSSKSKAMIAKILAGTVAGGFLGAGATYAANHLSQTDNASIEEEEKDEESATTTSGEKNKIVEENKDADDTSARIDEIEHNEQIRQQNEQVRQQNEHHREANEATRTSNDKDYLDEHDIKIQSYETRVGENGETYHMAVGSVDGHDAVFVDDGYGNLQGALVDMNDNDSLDGNEVIDLRPQNLNMSTLSQFEEQGTPSSSSATPAETSNTVSADSEVHVIAVEHNVDMEGQTVDVAAVNIGNDNMILVDVNQDCEVDLIAADLDGNQSISNDEIMDVSGGHLPMPTEADVMNNQADMAGNVGGDGLPDYSNNADITTYDI